MIKSNSDNKVLLNSDNSFTKEAKFDINNVYLNNLSSFSKISPFKADQGMKPYFYVKSPVNNQQHHTTGSTLFKSTTNGNEVSIYDIINQKESYMKNRNGNGFNKKKEIDRNTTTDNSFTRSGKTEDHYNLIKNTNRPNYLNLFLNHYENLSNLHVLLKNITPYIDVKSPHLVHL